MSEKQINGFPLETNSVSNDVSKGQSTDSDWEQAPPSSDKDGEPQKGLTFNWLNLVLGVAIFVWLSNGRDIFSDDWGFYSYLAIVVIIHELGHVIMGRSFGCVIKEMQVFFLPFVSYKSTQEQNGGSWRDIKWSLGVLPLGGVTMFMSRKTEMDRNTVNSEVERRGIKATATTSPYIEDKLAWQRLLISAAGVLFNIATFLLLYFILPFLPDGSYAIVRQLAIMSLFMAILNILPIYPLDGGAIVFALYEMLSGKKPSQGFTNVCAWIGFIIIILFFWVFPEWLGNIIGIVLGKFF